jgi:hypothetical protein
MGTAAHLSRPAAVPHPLCRQYRDLDVANLSLQLACPEPEGIGWAIVPLGLGGQPTRRSLVLEGRSEVPLARTPSFSRIRSSV